MATKSLKIKKYASIVKHLDRKNSVISITQQQLMALSLGQLLAISALKNNFSWTLQITERI